MLRCLGYRHRRHGSGRDLSAVTREGLRVSDGACSPVESLFPLLRHSTYSLPSLTPHLVPLLRHYLQPIPACTSLITVTLSLLEAYHHAPRLLPRQIQRPITSITSPSVNYCQKRKIIHQINSPFHNSSLFIDFP